jgi:hypothetical protein
VTRENRTIYDTINKAKAAKMYDFLNSLSSLYSVL